MSTSQKNRVVLAGALALALFVGGPMAAQSFPNHLGDLQAERAKYGATISAAEAGKLLNAVAWKFRAEGFGLLRKDGGNRCPMPNGTTISCDWLVHKPSGKGCDVLASGPDSDPPANGPANPTWCGGDSFDISRFVEPVDPGPTKPDDPPPPPNTDIIRAIVALESHLNEIDDRIDALARFVAEHQPVDVRPQLEDIRAAIKEKQIDYPVYQGRVLGVPVTLTPKR